MMPYAANGSISTDDFEGSIRITDEQYREALDGMRNGLQVSIHDGFNIGPAPIPIVLPEPIPTREELVAAAMLERDQRLSIAAIRIAPLQDAVDLGKATPEEVSNLEKWKQYRVAVNRAQDQKGYPQSINWPEEVS